MFIRQACEIDFHEKRCPQSQCGIGVLPYGRSEPFVVDDQGNVYCREHGSVMQNGYAEKLASYRDEQKTRRLAALNALELEPISSP
jgi:hypothetical protein